MGTSAARDERAIVRAEVAKRALALRRAGASYEKIASELGLRSRVNAFRIVKRAIARIPREEAIDVRTLELARLDVMLVAIWEKAAKGDEKARDGVLRIMKRRAEYLGLDEPKTLTHVHQLLEKELQGTLSTLEQRLDPDVFRLVLSALAEGPRPEAPAGALAPGGASGGDPP